MRRGIRWPLLIAWLVVLGIVTYLASNTHLVAPFASRLVSRHLLREVDGSLRVRDFRWRLPGSLDLVGASVTLKGRTGGVTFVTADTVALEFRVGELLRRIPRFRSVVVRGAEAYSSQGTPRQRTESKPWRWPRVNIDRVEVIECSLELSGQQGRLLERIPSLNWRGHLRAGKVLNIESRDADIWWETRDSRIGQLFGQILVDEDAVTVVGLNARLNDSPVVLDGSRAHNGDLDLRVRGQRLQTRQVENLLDTSLDFSALGDLEATFTGRGDTLVYEGVFTGELEGYRLEEVDGRATITETQVFFDRLSGRINSAHFDGQGTFFIDDPNSVSWELVGAVADVDLAQGLVPQEELPPTDGEGHLRLFHRDSPLLTTVTGTVYRGFIAAIPFDTCEVSVRVDASGVEFERVALRYQDQTGVLTGHTDTTRFFDGEVSLFVPDVSRLPREWGLAGISGRLGGQGSVRGPDGNLDFSGQVALRNLEVDAVRAELADLKLTIRDILGEPWVDLRVDGEGLRLGEVPLGSFAGAGSVSASLVVVDSLRAALGDTSLAISGAVAFEPPVTSIQVDRLGVELEGNRWRMARPARWTLGPEGVAVSEFRLFSEMGELAVSELALGRQKMAGAVLLRRFDLGLLNPFLRTTEPLGGEATAEFHLAGNPDEPDLQLEAFVTRSDLGVAFLDSLHTSLRFRDDTVLVDRFHLRTDHGLVTAAGSISHPGADLDGWWPGAGLQLELEVADGDWAFVEQFEVEALDRLAGQFDARLTVAGTTDRPQITGQWSSAPLDIHWLHLEKLTGGISAGPDRLVLSDLVARQGALEATGRIELPLTLDLAGVADIPPDGPFLMKIEIPPDSDLSALVPATSAFIDCGGRGRAEVTIAGPLDHPYWQGDLEVEGANFVLKGLEEVYRDVRAAGTFSGDRLTLHRIEGKEGARGTVAGTGHVEFSGLELVSFSLNLAVDRFLIASIPELRALVRSGEVFVSGVKVGPDSLMVPRFHGRLSVIEGRYTGDFSEKPGLSDPRAATVAPDWLADIQLVAPPRTVRIVNRAMELYMSGDVNLIREVEGLYLRGSMDIDSGRLPVFNNDFEVIRGRLDFSRVVGLIPRVDIEAETTVRVNRAVDGSGSNLERITVDVTGTLYEPVLSFSSESGYAREGIERMLLGLSPYPNDPQGQGGLRGASIAAGLNLLEREIATELDLIDTFDIDTMEREQVDGTGTLHPLIGVGKYLGSDFYIKFAQGISRADRDLLIEYQISDRLLLQSEIRRRIDELQGNLTYTLDLKYRMEY